MLEKKTSLSLNGIYLVHMIPVTGISDNPEFPPGKSNKSEYRLKRKSLHLLELCP